MELSMTPLRQRMIEDMQVRNLARHTQRAYLQQISLFARHFGKSPDILGPADIRAYQLHLSQEKRLSASSILVAVAAIRFLYKVTLGRGWSVDEIIPACRKPQKLPAVLSQDEVARFLDAVDSRKHRAILTICYAAGLRISEAVRLTPAAIDSHRMIICVEEGKGRKDRCVMLSPRLLEVLRALVQIAGAGKRPCCTVETSSLEHGIPHCRRKSTLDTQTSQSELSLADAMHQFDAGDRNRRGREALEAQHRGDSLFHAPMVLLDQIVQVLRRPQLRLGGQQAIGFQLTHCAVRRGIAVQSDRPGSIALAFDRLPKKRLGGRDIALGAQPEVNRPPRPIHGTIEKAPFASNFDVCLVHPP
jgi:integrase/recombinase XerD